MRPSRRSIWRARACTREASRGICHSRDRKSTRLNSSHSQISYAAFGLKEKNNNDHPDSHFCTRCKLLATVISDTIVVYITPPHNRHGRIIDAPGAQVGVLIEHVNHIQV